jgi:hypothetical protein
MKNMLMIPFVGCTCEKFQFLSWDGSDLKYFSTWFHLSQNFLWFYLW